MEIDKKAIKELLAKESTNEQKLKILLKHFSYMEVVILTAGPSINELDVELLKSFLANKLVIAIKQTFYIAPELVDIHLVNPFNYQDYDYGENNPIVMNVSLSEIKTPFTVKKTDLDFFINSKKTNRSDSLAQTRDFESYLLNKELERPFGPGIMYELGIYLPVFLKASSLTIFGWDIGSKNKNRIDRFYESNNFSKIFHNFIMKISIDFYNHYYIRAHNKINSLLYKYLGLKVILNNPGITDNEALFIAESTNDLYQWFKSKNLHPVLVSKSSLVDSVFKRIELK